MKNKKLEILSDEVRKGNPKFKRVKKSRQIDV
jgi:hypothetical protein